MSITHGKWLGPFKTPGNSINGADDPTPDDRGIFVIHAIHLHTGKVMLFSGMAEDAGYVKEVVLWDPLKKNAAGDPDSSINNFLTHVPPPGTDIFCCFHVQLPDGRILLMGGADHPMHGVGGHARGIKQVCIFDPKASPGAVDRDDAFTVNTPMSQARWYPTAILLADGNVVVFSGHTENVGPGNNFHEIANTVEIFSPPDYQPKVLTIKANAAGKDAAKFPTYPSMHLVKGGSIFHSGTTWRYEIDPNLDPNSPSEKGVPTVSFRLDRKDKSKGEFRHNGSADATAKLLPHKKSREEGTSILLSPAQKGKILILGGGRADPRIHLPNNFNTDAADATAKAKFPLQDDNSLTAEILDTQLKVPKWTLLPNMSFNRINVSAVNLVDGTVLILGGHDFYKWISTANGCSRSLDCEIFDPKTKKFKTVAKLNKPRMYHSAALLLLDGTVLVAGGADRDFKEPQPPPSNAERPNFPLNQKTFEIYQPPYLFISGARPTISKVTNFRGTENEINYGKEFFVESPEVNNIKQVVLIRPGAMTHHTDTEQRHIPFSLGQECRIDKGKVRTRMLNDPSIAPPGYYMVFIIDKAGRICELAKFALLKSWIPPKT